MLFGEVVDGNGLWDLCAVLYEVGRYAISLQFSVIHGCCYAQE